MPGYGLLSHETRDSSRVTLHVLEIFRRINGRIEFVEVSEKALRGWKEEAKSKVTRQGGLKTSDKLMLNARQHRAQA